MPLPFSVLLLPLLATEMELALIQRSLQFASLSMIHIRRVVKNLVQKNLVHKVHLFFENLNWTKFPFSSNLYTKDVNYEL